MFVELYTQKGRFIIRFMLDIIVGNIKCIENLAHLTMLVYDTKV